MILIVGLGNPGPKYAETRHNLGFRVLDALALRADLKWREEFKGEAAKGRIAGEEVLLLKPSTYMNLSGDSVIEAAQFYKIDTKKNLWVAHDDLDLPCGRLRISIGAGAGGHNGVSSIMERTGHKDFLRFRLGIGRPTDMTPIDDYVLRHPSDEQKPAIKELLHRAVEAVESAIKEGPTGAMNIFNVR